MRHADQLEWKHIHECSYKAQNGVSSTSLETLINPWNYFFSSEWYASSSRPEKGNELYFIFIRHKMKWNNRTQMQVKFACYD